MSTNAIQTQIDRITALRDDALAACREKGVTVPSGAAIDALPGYIRAIETGGGSSSGSAVQSCTIVGRGYERFTLPSGFTVDDFKNLSSSTSAMLYDSERICRAVQWYEEDLEFPGVTFEGGNDQAHFAYYLDVDLSKDPVEFWFEDGSGLDEESPWTLVVMKGLPLPNETMQTIPIFQKDEENGEAWFYYDSSILLRLADLNRSYVTVTKTDGTVETLPYESTEVREEYGGLPVATYRSAIGKVEMQAEPNEYVMDGAYVGVGIMHDPFFDSDEPLNYEETAAIKLVYPCRPY